MSRITISMPHRHTVVYEDGAIKVEFETELLVGGIAFYRNTAKVVSGVVGNLEPLSDAVEHWLRSKFSKVEVS